MPQNVPKKVKKALVNIDRTRATGLIIAEFLVGGFLSIYSLGAYIWLAREVLARQTYAFDIQISQTIYAFRSAGLTNIMSGVSFLGSEKMAIPIVMLAFILFWKKYKEDVLIFTGTVMLGLSINLFLKFLILRPRPEIAPLYDELFSSFPSGHSMNSVVLYVTLAYFAFRYSKSMLLSLLSIGIAVLIILLVGFSRIYLGVHYPTDVIGGFIAGFWWVVTVLMMEKTVQLVRMKKTERKKILS